jgi:hypothetical protein
MLHRVTSRETIVFKDDKPGIIDSKKKRKWGRDWKEREKGREKDRNGKQRKEERREMEKSIGTKI